MANAATVDDFYALGLPPDAIASAENSISRVTHTGSGAGTVTAGGAPLGVYDVRIQVVTSGLPGAATVRWTFDAGATWSSTVTAPSGAALVLGVSGLTATFEGALVANDLYSFVGSRALERHLAAGNAKIRAYLRRRFPDGLAAWDDSLLDAACAVTALAIITQRGFDPRNPGDKAIADRAKAGLEYAQDVGASIAHPDTTLDVTDTAPVALSDTPRED